MIKPDKRLVLKANKFYCLNSLRNIISLCSTANTIIMAINMRVIRKRFGSKIDLGKLAFIYFNRDLEF